MQAMLTGHTCNTAQKRGWGGLKNGDLLRAAEEEFDLFITADQNLRYQQNLAGRRIAILQLSTNKMRRLQDAGKLIQATVEKMGPGQFTTLEFPDSDQSRTRKYTCPATSSPASVS